MWIAIFIGSAAKITKCATASPDISDAFAQWRVKDVAQLAQQKVSH